jgi:hypothetical protein
MTDKELRDYIINNGMINEDDEVLLANGYADAFLGITDLEPKRAVYDKNKMIEIVMLEDKCSVSESIDWLEFNTWCAYVGENTPIYIDTI